MSRRHIGFALRLAVTVAFGALALWGTGAGAVLDEMAQGELTWMLGALSVLVASYALGGVRWWVLLRGQNLDVSLPTVLRLTWIGLFASNLLPTGFGGDAVRAWMGGRRAGALALVTASVLVDRLTAVWALLTLGVLAVLVNGSQLPSAAVVSLLLVSAAVAVTSVLLLTPSPARWLTRQLRRWPRAEGRIERLGAGLGQFAARPRLLAAAVGVSVVCQACVIVAAWMMARGLGLDLGIGVVAVTVPVALLATAVPTSINGLGVHQAVFRALLVPAGLTASEAVAFSVTTFAAGAIVSLPGLALWGRGRRASTAPASLSPSLLEQTPSVRA